MFCPPPLLHNEFAKSKKAHTIWEIFLINQPNLKNLPNQTCSVAEGHLWGMGGPPAHKVSVLPAGPKSRAASQTSSN